MKLLLYSDPIPLDNNNVNMNDKIHLFVQYYIPRERERYVEIFGTLYNNICNNNIDYIHLLNEEIYDNPHRDGILSNTKIIQTCIRKRLTFQDVFMYIRSSNITGYIIIANADIFFDESLYNVRCSGLSYMHKQMITQLRYEYNRNGTSRIFGPRIDSQDTWIFHTNEFIQEKEECVFNFCLGTPGCDNKMIYLLKVLGYTIFNDPSKIKTYHNHQSNIRNYPKTLQLPFGYITPYGFPDMDSSLGPDYAKIYKNLQYISFDDNIKLYDYINDKLEKKIPFIIPRIAGVENNIVYAVQNNIYFLNMLHHMKNNAGVQLDNLESVISYSNLYLDAFKNCEVFFCWELQGNYINHIKDSHNYILTNYPNKNRLWAFTLDIFHYIDNPWTRVLIKKRVLIISSFAETMKEQLPNLDKIYNIDLFPECSFLFLKPPLKQGNEVSLDFQSELQCFYLKLDELKDLYDIALVSSGGNGNIICNYIFENHNKSAIYVGGVLQMYFGILGNRWIQERLDIVNLYYNKYWTRPKESERPLGHENIEHSCYW